MFRRKALGEFAAASPCASVITTSMPSAASCLAIAAPMPAPAAAVISATLRSAIAPCLARPVYHQARNRRLWRAAAAAAGAPRREQYGAQPRQHNTTYCSLYPGQQPGRVLHGPRGRPQAAGGGRGGGGLARRAHAGAAADRRARAGRAPHGRAPACPGAAPPRPRRGRDPGARLRDPGRASRTRLRAWFERTVFPVLTPLAFDPGRPFPHISNLSLNLAVLIRDRAGNDTSPASRSRGPSRASCRSAPGARRRGRPDRGPLASRASSR